MNYCLRGIKFITFFLFLFLQTTVSVLQAEVNSFSPSSSVVEIYVTTKSYTNSAPWNSDTASYIGSGFVIAGKRIVTNAHIIDDNTFIEVHLSGDSKRYKATVKAVSHEMDLAVLELDQPSFFENTQAVELGDLPEVHQKVVVYGYPAGGNALSITEGVISRIEYQNYVHSGLGFLAIQVDAAINHGNSGGPAIVDDKVVGVVMQFASAENDMGYIIPVNLLKRFLKDISDGKNDGIPRFPIEYQSLQSPILREGFYQLPKEKSGILISNICANTSAEGLLQAGDIITKISGNKIENNGKVFESAQKRFNFYYYIDTRQVGEILELDIVRKGESKKISFPLKDVTELNYEYGQDPRYFIYGGYVFTASEYAQECLSPKDYAKSETKDKQEQIQITKVLPSLSNTGTHYIAPATIEKVNEQTFNTFKEFYCLISNANTPIILLQDDTGFQLAIDREVATREHQSILEKYRIQTPQSAEIDAWEKDASCTKKASISTNAESSQEAD